MLYSSAFWTLSFCSKSSCSSRRLKPCNMFFSCKERCCCQSGNRFQSNLCFELVCYFFLHTVPLSRFVPSSDAPISSCVWLATFSSRHQTSSLMFTENKWQKIVCIHSYAILYSVVAHFLLNKHIRRILWGWNDNLYVASSLQEAVHHLNLLQVFSVWLF